MNKNGFEWLRDFGVDYIGLQEIKAKDDQIPKEIYNLGFDNIILN